MKALKRQLLLCDFLMRDAIIIGSIAALLLIGCNSLSFALIKFNRTQLFSDVLNRPVFAIIYAAAIVIAMAMLAAMIVSKKLGSNSLITLHMLPTDRTWMLIGWMLAGVFMLLVLTAAENLSIRISHYIWILKLDRHKSAVYFEPNAVMYAYRRVGFLGWVLPTSLCEWLRYAALTLGAPIASSRTALGFLAGRPFSTLIAAALFILACVFMAFEDSMPFGVLLTLASTASSFVGAQRLLKRGDTV